ncbi:MAG: phosphonatase-like hydrolase [Flavobacteriaceae bacterium]
MHKIELVVFDMAGTVVNEDNVVYKTLHSAINKKGYLITLDFVLEHGAGKEKYQAIKDILREEEGSDQDDIAAEIFKDFGQMLEDAYRDLIVTSYPGIEELIKALRRAEIKIALNTGYNRNTAFHLLNKMNWIQHQQYDALVTADDVLLGRPNPDMIFEAMEILNVFDPEKVLKAGDSIIDIEEGKNANCGVTVGVTTGAHTKSQLQSANPTYVVDSLLELLDFIET